MRKIIATYGMFNALSLNVYDIDHDDYRVLAGIGDDKPYWSKIRTTKKGRSYFMKYGRRYHLDMFMPIM